MILAEKTLATIAERMEADQGARYRTLLREEMAKLDDAYRGEESPYRTHLGVSSIGTQCDRQLWYRFRWYKCARHDAKTLRLFNRGHLEEGRLVALLRSIDCDVHSVTPGGQQYRVSLLGGHFGSAIDSVILGLPDAPTIPVLGEFKTHGQTSFDKLVKDGVAKTKIEHYVQMQIYMRYWELTLALYLAVNKNTDELHAELIELSPDTADRFYGRAADILNAKLPPRRLKGASMGYFACKFCDFKDICLGHGVPERTCRSCVHAQPMNQEHCVWRCDRHDIPVLSKDVQIAGCSTYNAIKEA